MEYINVKLSPLISYKELFGIEKYNKLMEECILEPDLFISQVASYVYINITLFLRDVVTLGNQFTIISPNEFLLYITTIWNFSLYKTMYNVLQAEMFVSRVDALNKLFNVVLDIFDYIDQWITSDDAISYFLNASNLMLLLDYPYIYSLYILFIEEEYKNKQKIKNKKYDITFLLISFMQGLLLLRDDILTTFYPQVYYVDKAVPLRETISYNLPSFEEFYNLINTTIVYKEDKDYSKKNEKSITKETL